jgi:hypothetical protein
VLLRELLEVQQRVLGAEHPNTLNTSHIMCVTLGKQRMYGEAEARCRELLSAQQRVLGVEHPSTRAISQLLAEISSHT